MSSRARLVWSEGMFLRTQHFQQLDRWIESQLALAVAGLSGLAWGLRRLELDEGLLVQGRVGLRAAAGILPDGTPFAIPDRDPQPEPLALPRADRPTVVHLALPLRVEGGQEVEPEGGAEAGLRLRGRTVEVRDANLGHEERASIEIAEPRFRLIAEGGALDGHATLALARVVQVEATGALALDRDFVPPCLAIAASPVLLSFLEELAGKLETIAAERAAFVGGKRLAGAGDIADFLVLLLCNRSLPLVRHLAEQRILHGEALYAWLAGLLGEAASFVAGELRPARLPPYRHGEPEPAFQALFQELRRVLLELARPERKAVQIRLKAFPSGVRAAEVQDRALYAEASFVLAFNAPAPAETIRQRLPGQIKIGPAEELQAIVRAAVPGIPIRHLPTVPREIPLHRGMVYFELDRANDFWRRLSASAGLALHVTGELREGMELELWAIRD
ncbi:MAG: type VI secretion system baseplate subunit TssK [Geminicoccaceae bacterium]|nr:type VI secretion system baseplate subunit TssK [Geminicoccaceae bacterium]